MNIIDRFIVGSNNFPFRRFIGKLWYNHMASKYKSINIKLMNYGYVDPDNNVEQLKLDPDGYFLFTDFRPRESVADTQKQLLKARFSIVREENITDNVCASMELEHQRKVDIIERQVPIIFRWLASYFAAAKGTPMHQGLKARELEYLCYSLRKQLSASDKDITLIRSCISPTLQVSRKYAAFNPETIGQ